MVVKPTRSYQKDPVSFWRFGTCTNEPPSITIVGFTQSEIDNGRLIEYNAGKHVGWS